MKNALPTSVKYRWTSLDKADAEKPQTNSGPLLTPYKIYLGKWPEAKTFTVGMTVDVPISNSHIAAELGVYYSETETYGWEDVPAAFMEQKTLGQLCHALTTKLPNSYSDDHFDLQSKSPLVRKICMKRLFEYWGNTDYRYAVIESTGKDPYVGNTWEQTPAFIGSVHIKKLYTAKTWNGALPATVSSSAAAAAVQHIKLKSHPKLSDKVAHLKSLHDAIVSLPLCQRQMRQRSPRV